jgi:CheY-like chemotaxis protein
LTSFDPPSSRNDLVPSSPPRAKLLLVDDTYANLVALTGVLEPLDQDLVTARSGEEALRRLLVADFAVILLDVQMPGLDGFQTATLIRKRERCRATPIIFLTAHLGQPRHVFEGYAHGAVDYLVKPYDPDVLRAKVRVLVDLHLAREKERRDTEHARRRERHEVERASFARLQRWIDAVPHAMFVARPDGAIEMINARFAAATGMDLDEAIAHGWTHAAVVDERAEAERNWTNGVGAGAPFELASHRWRRRGGGSSAYRVCCVPELDGARRPIAWICTATEDEASRTDPPPKTVESSSRTADTVPALARPREHDAR